MSANHVLVYLQNDTLQHSNFYLNITFPVCAYFVTVYSLILLSIAFKVEVMITARVEEIRRMKIEHECNNLLK